MNKVAAAILRSWKAQTHPVGRVVQFLCLAVVAAVLIVWSTIGIPEQDERLAAYALAAAGGVGVAMQFTATKAKAIADALDKPEGGQQ